jgi:RNase P subunit RPR2
MDKLPTPPTLRKQSVSVIFLQRGIQRKKNLLGYVYHPEQEAEMTEDPEEYWQTLSKKVLTDVRAWRQAHPKATFRQIEQEVHTRMSQLEALLLQETAQQSKSRDWSGVAEEERPSCPVCRTPLQARGKQTRRLQGAAGQEVKLTRTYGTCPTCGTGLFPPG